MKIFKFGSCRTNIEDWIDPKYQIEYNYDLTHTTKEVLMYLDILDGLDLSKIPSIDCLMKYAEKFNINSLKSKFDESDIIIIEVSSLKIVEMNGYFYQIVRYKENNPDIKFNIFLQKESEFIEDIKKIYERIAKPIIFVPHITMNFDKEPRYKSEENLVINNQTLIESRKLIEKYISENTKIHIKTSEVFFDYHYSDICDCSKKFDPNHYTKLGYQLITSKIEEVIKSL